MGLFRRDKVDETVESASVYDTPPRERNWMAWLLSLVTLLVTVAVIVGLFYGGRWVYRKATGNNNKQATTQNTPASTHEEDEDENDEDEPEESSGSTSSTSTTSPTPSASQNTNTSTPAPGSTTTSSTSGDLPETGPGDTVAIFVAVSLLGYLAHRRFAD